MLIALFYGKEQKIRVAHQESKKNFYSSDDSVLCAVGVLFACIFYDNVKFFESVLVHL